MKKSKHLFIILFLATTIIELKAQSDLKIFGFFQSRIQKTDQSFNLSGNVPTPMGPVSTTFQSIEDNYTSPDVQQLNLFFKKDLGSSFTSWINFEFTNSFSSERDWGYINLEEAWVNYEHNDYLNVKGGWIIPHFNYLNEVKNRMPLLPYIIRPLAYESSLKGILNTSDYVPERAFIQIEGNYYWDDFGLNYSVFVGPSESSYFTSGNTNATGSVVSGRDTTNFKLFGGRLGFEYRNLRLGVSATFDKDNQQEVFQEDIPRTRIGVDFGVAKYGLFLEGELIYVSLDSKKTDDDLDKIFYYGTLGYDFNESLFAYGSFSHMKDKQSPFFKLGYNSILGGLGYRISYAVVLKAQYGYYYSDGDVDLTIAPELPPITANLDLEVLNYGLAISILF